MLPREIVDKTNIESSRTYCTCLTALWASPLLGISNIQLEVENLLTHAVLADFSVIFFLLWRSEFHLISKEALLGSRSRNWPNVTVMNWGVSLGVSCLLAWAGLYWPCWPLSSSTLHFCPGGKNIADATPRWLTLQMLEWKFRNVGYFLWKSKLLSGILQESLGSYMAIQT